MPKEAALRSAPPELPPTSNTIQNPSPSVDRSGGVPPDLTLCDLEPITRSERIQSFGFLIAVSQDWAVTRVSSNVESMLGIDPKSILRTKLDLWVDVEVLHDIRNRLSGLAGSRAVERIYGARLIAGRGPFDLAVHYADKACVFEGEPAGLDNRVDAASLVRKMVARLGTHPTMDEFHRDAARQVRAITGFDRVMIYRFLPSGAGEVIAEVTRPGAETFLGLHYPATDIPVQARALYLLNPFRIIADVGSTTVPLLSFGDETAEPLNLCQAITRAVSPVHIEYLRNMGVGASASISIIVDGRLWGLIACHSEKPRLPTFVIRTAAELFGQMYSMTLESRLRQTADHHDRRGRDAVSRMVAAIADKTDLLGDAAWLQDIVLEMIECDGIAVSLNGAVTTSGATPPANEIEALARLLDSVSPHKIFVTDRLGSLNPEFLQQPSVAAGVLAIPISQDSSSYILFFRREQLKDIRWAGDPAKSSSENGPTQRLSPRKSFAAFSQSVRGQSRPFGEPEQYVAERIRSGIIEVVLRGIKQTQLDQTRAVGRQEILIAELNHRVRNVLALIRGLVNQTIGEGGDSAHYVESLNGRVQALARAHDRVTRQNWGPGPLNAIFDDEIGAYVPTQRARFIISGPYLLLQPQAYSTFALIIHELVTNSAKYGALSDGGTVQVALKVVPGEGLHLKWVERGGPLVVTPTRRGFGSVIIERVVPFDLQGTASISYLPGGLEAEFVIPERYLASSAETSAATTTISPADDNLTIPTRQSRPLEGLNVLLVEDNLIVALEAEDLLRALGAIAVSLASSTAAAAKIHGSSKIDFAVLDVNLGFESSLEFASALRVAKIPFIFASGYGDQRHANEIPVQELTVSKPYDRDHLSTAIVKALAPL